MDPGTTPPDDALGREELLAELRRLRSMIEANPQVPWSADAEGRITDFSQRWLDFTGLTREAALGEGWSQVPHPDDLPAMAEAWTRSVQMGESYDVEHRIRLADGSYRWMRSRAVPSRDAMGKVVEWHGSTEDVHDRKTAEAQTQAALESLRLMQESLSLAMKGGRMGWWRRDLLTDKVTWSPELEAIFGLEPGAFGGTRDRFLDFVHPDDVERFKAVVAHAVQTRSDYAAEFRFRRVDGTTGWMEGRGRAVGDADGRPSAIYGIGIDVTEHREAKEAADRQLRVRQTIADNADSPLMLLDREGYTTYANPAFFRVTDYAPEDLLGKTAHELVHYRYPDGRPYPIEECPIDNSYANLEPLQNLEETFVRKDGSLFPVVAHVAPLRDESGKSQGGVLEFRDVSHERERERALRESESQYRQIAEAIPQIVWTTRPDGYHDFFNQRWYDYTGMTRGDERGWQWKDYLHPDDYERTLEIWSRCLASGEPYHVEYRFRQGVDGVYRWFLGQALPIRDETGGIVRWFGALTDIHDLKETERSLAHVNEVMNALAQELEERVRERTVDLQAANDALTAFTYHVSHDLRGPLRAIVSTSRIVQEDYAERLPEEAIALLDRQAEAAGKLGRLIDDLLRLSRLSHTEIRKAPVDLSVLAAEVAAESMGMHPETQVAVVVEDGLTATADPDLVRLALGNLIENAVKYSPQGGRVAVGRRDDAFFVSDEGIGIDPRYFDKIFEPFQRLHRDDEFAGTGVGLSNVRQIVERHGGKVWVESSLGDGSTFYFTLGKV